jgi:hypothetical protein
LFLNAGRQRYRRGGLLDGVQDGRGGARAIGRRCHDS